MLVSIEWLLSLAIILLLFLLFNYIQNRKLHNLTEALEKQDSQQLLSQWLAEINTSLHRNTDFMSRQLANTNDAVNQRLDSAAQLLRLLNKDLGHVHEIGQQMRDFEHFFRSPKMRGRLGERMMQELIFQVLPRSIVSMQHRFQSGAIVDALIKLEGGGLPIDAKFPLENYQKAQHARTDDAARSFRKEFKRDVKRHINAVHSKYILPGEGTLDFAVMYVPSDTLYYEIVSDDALINEAESKNVLCVSPNSFYYFLKLILAGLYSHRIEKTAALVMQNINAFEQSIAEIANDMNTLLAHINNSHNAGARVANKIQALGRKLESVINMKK
jgi:DNA recombination protein RmuC